MEDANYQQAYDLQQRQYMDALEAFNRARDYQKAGAIESLRKLGVQEDGEYRTQAVEVLAAFVRSTARIADKNTKRRIDPTETALNLASALHALSEIQSKMEFSASFFDKNILLFENLDLSELKFTMKKSISRMNFRACNFTGCNFVAVTFTDTNFWVCNFNKAILSSSHFAPGLGGININLSKSTFEDTLVEFTNFEHVSQISEGQLLKVRYSYTAPPKNVPRTSGNRMNGVLPTPFDYHKTDPTKSGYISVKNAREICKKYGGEKSVLRPYHKDGTPVPIVNPDDPNVPKDIILG